MRTYVIGAGGVGSWLVPSLCMLIGSGSVTVIDGDMLEEKNLNRQLFTPEEIGRNKAEALAKKYGCDFRAAWFTVPLIRPNFDDWMIVCVDNDPARRDALLVADRLDCRCIFAANELHSAEAYIYLPEWRETNLDPRIYYPEINTNQANDPRALTIGCTGHAQQENPQLVTANLTAADFAMRLFTLWEMELFRKPHLKVRQSTQPYKLVANLSSLEFHRVGEPKQNTERTK